jgi:nitrate reductase NapAB chaperone NapD
MQVFGMNISGILVIASPTDIDAVLEQLASMDGVEVHLVDRTGGRIVVVQEGSDVGAEVAGFSRIRALKHVLCADLVCHYFGDTPDDEPHTEAALASLAVPMPGAAPAERG